MKVYGINWSGNIAPQFKLAAVLGPSRVLGKMRVQVWLHAPRRWAKACAVDVGKLFLIDEKRLTPRQATVLRAARAAAKVLDAERVPSARSLP